MHGPSSSLPSPWAAYPIVPVLDSVAPTLSGELKRKWKRRRSFALRQWSRVGIQFEVSLGDESHPAYDPESPNYWRWNPDFDPADETTWHMVGDEDAFMRGLVVPGYMHLLTMPENWFGGNTPGVGWMFETGSFAIWNMESLFARSRRGQKYITTHEIGHGLGLGHAYESRGGDPESVMYVSIEGYAGTGIRPNAHDLDSLRSWYGR